MAETPYLSVYGHVTIDQIMSVNRFPNLNESVNILSKHTLLGGTGTNISISAAKLGVPTALCAFIGDDFPKMLMDEILESNVITDDLVVADGYESSLAMVINNQDMEQEVYFYQGPQGSATKIGKYLTDSARKSKFVHFCTGEPDYYLGVIERLSDCGNVIAMDPAQEVYKLWDSARMKATLELSDYLFCNEFEAKIIEGYLGIGDVMDVDRDVVIRTEGAAGGTAKVKGEVFKFPAVKGEAFVDATGAGDNFRAGFYSGLYHGYGMHESITLASVASSFVVEKVGALTNVPTWDMVLKRAKGRL